MRRLSALTFIAALLSMPLWVGSAWSQDSDRVEYLFLNRDRLHRELEERVGSKITTTDRLVLVYSGEQDGYMFFDTHYFRCAIRPSAKGADYVKEVFDLNAKQFADIRDKIKGAKNQDARDAFAKEIYARWKKKALVTIFGKVDRPEIWGKVDSDAKGYDVVPERIVILCDRVEKPRKRWYDEID